MGVKTISTKEVTSKTPSQATKRREKRSEHTSLMPKHRTPAGRNNATEIGAHCGTHKDKNIELRRCHKLRSKTGWNPLKHRYTWRMSNAGTHPCLRESDAKNALPSKRKTEQR
uniref:Uncharacterized protein n=1 Tax=Trypanosoma congolense (strain IL3000) TaxID=1068625 RepID=G0UL22_TRYCI|nr:hypothetical protein, unlikely [Trypanosoma congolense IL3000]